MVAPHGWGARLGCPPAEIPPLARGRTGAEVCASACSSVRRFPPVLLSAHYREGLAHLSWNAGLKCASIGIAPARHPPVLGVKKSLEVLGVRSSGLRATTGGGLVFGSGRVGADGDGAVATELGAAAAASTPRG